ncbi:MAG: hypothetical protein CMM47_00710 [Rhodospirillaceae bacterium]|nr:hypothetical protein [Rhodospirillaceae bacterium]MBM84493.1 hypothetical protein [Rhodospirillaceae bacterium]MBM84530.1 hypothetical protein [Rhodospirillaceae bacterium]|tara:strand:- start:902 stop:1237 length:336 start_codon:yes stop_codon:yes gene_type:complete
MEPKNTRHPVDGTMLVAGTRIIPTKSIPDFKTVLKREEVQRTKLERLLSFTPWKRTKITITTESVPNDEVLFSTQDKVVFVSHRQYDILQKQKDLAKPDFAAAGINFNFRF